MGFTSNLSFVRKRPATTTVATILLAAAAYFVIRGGGSGEILQEWQVQTKGGVGTGSGVSVAIMTSSGSLTLTGGLLVNDQKTGSGRIKCAGTDGCGLVLNDADGTGCWAIEVNNGTLITHGLPAAECP